MIYKNLCKKISYQNNIDNWQSIAVKPIYDLLAPIGMLSDFPIFTSSIYFGEHNISPYKRNELKGSTITIFLRSKFAKQLLKAESLLPPKHYFIVFDGWRSYTLQKSLYFSYFKKLKEIKKHWSCDMLKEETSKYVSFPSKKKLCPSPHNSGGAVDLGIVYLNKNDDLEIKKIISKYKYDKSAMIDYAHIFLKNSKMLDFGCQFDYAGDKSHIMYFENLTQKRKLKENEKEILLNRRLLFNVMNMAGIKPYPYEFWHYNSIYTQMGAFISNKKVAYYDSISLSYANKKFEEKRLDLDQFIDGNTDLPKALKISPVDNFNND